MYRLLHEGGHAVALAMEAIAVMLIAVGGLEALIGIVRALLKRATGTQRCEVWLDFARWLVAALTFQLAADIASTSFSPSWEEVGRLAAVAAIRTFLSFFLDREVERTRDVRHARGAIGKVSAAVSGRLGTRHPGASMSTSAQTPKTSPMAAERDASTELSARRTGMSFQRTRLSADRTLMSVMRTSLSLIGFGFTIYQVFEKMHDAQLLKSSSAPRHFGEVLVYLGIGMLVLGIGYHVAFMLELRREREALKHDGLIHAESRFPPSLTLIVAVLLLAVGILAVFSMSFRIGPFG